jgi:hypothetical protein
MHLYGSTVRVHHKYAMYAMIVHMYIHIVCAGSGLPGTVVASVCNRSQA